MSSRKIIFSILALTVLTERIYANIVLGYVDRSYSAPYTDSEPVSAAVTQKTNKSKPRAPDTYEMESRPRTKTSANPSRSNATKAPAVTNLDDSQRSYSDHRISTNSEPESSYF